MPRSAYTQHESPQPINTQIYGGTLLRRPFLALERGESYREPELAERHPIRVGQQATDPEWVACGEPSQIAL
jgi:hypothetical protein